MSDPVTTEEVKVKQGRKPYFKGRFLIVSVVFHLLLGIFATYLIVQTLVPRKQTFQAGPKAPSPSKAFEKQVQLAKKQKTMSAPAPSKRIATTGLAKVNLPEMPEMPTDNAPNKMQGMEGVTGIGNGPAGLSGSPGAGAAMPFFGLPKGGLGLQGTFYDLKQTSTGNPSDMDVVGEYTSPDEQKRNVVYDTTVRKVVGQRLSTASLNKFFIGPSPLYTTQLYIPQINAEEAPKAFNLEGKVKGRRWIVVYRGTVIAPESGKFRFVGNADDVIAVKFGSKVVLDKFAPRDKVKGVYMYGQQNNGHAQGIIGETFNVQAGSSYPIDILIGEKPGGSLLAYLLIEKVGREYQKEGAGDPTLPLFKLAPGKNPERGKSLPPLAPDTTWSVWKAAPAKTTFGGR